MFGSVTRKNSNLSECVVTWKPYPKHSFNLNAHDPIQSPIFSGKQVEESWAKSIYCILSQFQFLCSWLPMFFPLTNRKSGYSRKITQWKTLLSIMFPHMFPYTIQFLMLISLYRFHMKIRILHMIPHENQDVAYDFPWFSHNFPWFIVSFMFFPMIFFPSKSPYKPQDEDNIYVDVVSFPEDAGAPGAPGVGGLIFGVRRGEEDAQVAAAGAWVPQQPHLYLFTAPWRCRQWSNVWGKMEVKWRIERSRILYINYVIMDGFITFTCYAQLVGCFRILVSPKPFFL